MPGMTERVCPNCGGDLAMDQSTCTQCGAAMASTSADTVLGLTVNAQPAVDVAAMMRQALAEQKSGEDIDLPLRRVLKARDPAGEEEAYKIITEYLNIMSWRLGIKRQQAAVQLAQAEAELKMTPDGKPFLESLTTNVIGLESLPAGIRAQVTAQLKDNLAHAKTGPIIIPRHLRRPGQRRRQSWFWPRWQYWHWPSGGD